MQKLLNSQKQLRTSGFVFYMMLLVFLLASTAVATAGSVTISANEAFIGDIISASGQNMSGSELPVSITFTKKVPVIDGKYQYELMDIVIPAGKPILNIKSRYVQDMTVSTVFPIPMIEALLPTIDVTANRKGVASASTKRIPAGTYDVRVSGNSNASMVDITFMAKSNISLDASGNFDVSYSTDYMPAGLFLISLDGATYEVLLKERELTPGPVYPAGGSNTGTELQIVPASELGIGTGGEAVNETPLATVPEPPKEVLPVTEETQEVPQEVKLSFWQRIILWIKGLFN